MNLRQEQGAESVSYFGLRINAGKYKALQICGIILALLGSATTWISLRDHAHFVVRNLWWIFALIAVGETIETIWMLRRRRS